MKKKVKVIMKNKVKGQYECKSKSIKKIGSDCQKPKVKSQETRVKS